MGKERDERRLAESYAEPALCAGQSESTSEYRHNFRSLPQPPPTRRTVLLGHLQHPPAPLTNLSHQHIGYRLQLNRDELRSPITRPSHGPPRRILYPPTLFSTAESGWIDTRKRSVEGSGTAWGCIRWMPSLGCSMRQLVFRFVNTFVFPLTPGFIAFLFPLFSLANILPALLFTAR
ncbi:hypothetical protein BJ912DRAFT_1062788 [Pholiota molesta]|nr:hypothetical protein BJ912DRAFT_1062788 [Pholiota molesta]